MAIYGRKRDFLISCIGEKQTGGREKMSNHFEDNEEDSDSESNTSPASGIPGKIYLTVKGFERMSAELKYLLSNLRPKVTDAVSRAAALGDRSENADYQYGKRRLREIDRRVYFLEKRLEAAQVIDPLMVKSDRVLFGATVVVSYDDGTEKTYRIVGPDELDPATGRISFKSPLGRAVMGKKEGDEVSFVGPKGEVNLVLENVRFEKIEIPPYEPAVHLEFRG